MKSRVLPMIAIGAALVAVGIAAIAAWRLGKTPAGTAQASAPDLWDPAWTAMRTCVLGRDPASTDVGEAIAAADLIVPDRTCGHELVALARAAGGDAEWAGVRRGIAELADALGRHGQRRQQLPQYTSFASGPDKPDPLPPVFSNLVKAVERVKPPPPVPPAVRVLTPLDARPLVLENQMVTSVSVWRNMLTATIGQSYGDRRQVVFIGGEPRALTQYTYGLDTVPSPNGTWYAYVQDGGARAKIIVASLDGDVATVATVVNGSSYVWAVIGEGQNRIVVYTDYGEPYIARSTDGGVHWKKTGIDLGTTGYFATAVSADGKYLEIVWADTETRRMVLDPEVNATGALPASESVAPTLSWLQCASGAVWLGLFESETEYVVRRANAATASGRFKTQPYFTACSAEKLVLRSEDQEFACDASTCAPLAKLAASPLATVAGGDVLRYQTWDNVIALWWGDKPPRFARLPGNRQVAGIVDDHGTAIAILQAESRVEYAVLPK